MDSSSYDTRPLAYLVPQFLVARSSAAKTLVLGTASNEEPRFHDVHHQEGVVGTSTLGRIPAIAALQMLPRRVVGQNGILAVDEK